MTRVTTWAVASIGLLASPRLCFGAGTCSAEHGTYNLHLSRPSGTCPRHVLESTPKQLKVTGRLPCGRSRRRASTLRAGGCRYRCGPYVRKVERRTLRFSFRCQVRCGKSSAGSKALGLTAGGSCRFDAVAVATRASGPAANASAADAVALPRDRRLLWSSLRAATISRAAVRRARAAMRRARLAREIAKLGMLKILGAKGSGSGSVADVLSSGTVSSGVAGGVAGGVGVSGVVGGSVRRRRDGAGGAGGGGGAGSLGARATRVKPEPTKPTGPTRPTKVAIGPLRLSPRLEPMAIQRALARQIAGVRRCLGRASSAGTVRLILLVGRDGAARVVEVKTADRPFARCIERLAATWRFEPPVGDRAARLTVPYVLSR